MSDAVDPTVPPSGTGCVECDAVGGWWVHLRRCAACGHIGCCDDSLARHATAHWRSSGHPVIRSFEPGEDWFWNYDTNSYYDGPNSRRPTIIPTTSPLRDLLIASPRTGWFSFGVVATEFGYPGGHDEQQVRQAQDR